MPRTTCFRCGLKPIAALVAACAILVLPFPLFALALPFLIAKLGRPSSKDPLHWNGFFHQVAYTTLGSAWLASFLLTSVILAIVLLCLAPFGVALAYNRFRAWV